MKKKVGMERDRISKLPDFILHHILSFLEPKEAFASACVSRLWLNVWLTCPYLTFSFYPDHPRKRDKFAKFVENTISRFSESEFSVQSVRINAVYKSYNYISHRYPSSLLEKSIRFAVERQVQILRVECGRLCELRGLPETIFAAKSLIELELIHCNFDDMNMFSSATKFEVNNLKRLIFDSVSLNDEWVLDKLFSNIPLVEEIELSFCDLRFKKLRVSNVPKLKRFKMHIDRHRPMDISSRGYKQMVEIVAPSLESFDYFGEGTLNIDACQNLKRLILNVECDTLKSFCFSNFPFLKFLGICNGYWPFMQGSTNLGYNISSQSLQQVQVFELLDVTSDSEVIIEVPNLLLLHYNGYGCNSMCFRNPPKQLKVNLFVPYHQENEDPATWFLNVRSFLMKLVDRMEIYLSLEVSDLNKCFVIEESSDGLPKPEVEDMVLSLSSRKINHQALADGLFWSCHPTHLSVRWGRGVKPDSKFIECLWENVRKRAGTVLKCCCDDQDTKFEGANIDCFNAKGDAHDRRTLYKVMKAVKEGKGVCFKLKWSAD